MVLCLHPESFRNPLTNCGEVYGLSLDCFQSSAVFVSVVTSDAAWNGSGTHLNFKFSIATTATLHSGLNDTNSNH